MDKRKSAAKKVHARRRSSTRARVAEAVRAIEGQNRIITFSLVAEVAGVSRPTLYNDPEIRGLIDRKIAEQRAAKRRLGSKLRSDARAIARLKGENRKLREKLARR